MSSSVNASVNVLENVNAFEKAEEAALKAGAMYPKAVAEYLKPRLTVIDTADGPTVMVRKGMAVEPMEFAMSQLKISAHAGVLFYGGEVNMQNIDTELYRAIRKHNPELLGLRKNRR